MMAPTKIYIGPALHAVKEVDEMRREGTWGRIDTDKQEIHLLAGLGHTNKCVTLLEEIGHSIFEQIGIALSIERQDDILPGFMTLLLDTLRRNPELTAFLLVGDEQTS